MYSCRIRKTGPGCNGSGHQLESAPITVHTVWLCFAYQSFMHLNIMNLLLTSDEHPLENINLSFCGTNSSANIHGDGNATPIFLRQ